MRLACTVILAALFSTSVANAQTATSDVPRTPEGLADLTGYWTSRGLTTMERAEPGPLAVSDEDASAIAARTYAFLRSPQMEAAMDPDAFAANVGMLAKVGGQWRSSFVTIPEDGQLPLTEAALGMIKDADAADETSNSDGPEARGDFDRCLAGTGTAPLYQVPSNNARRIVQTDDHLMIYTEEGGDVRIVGINASPRPPGLGLIHGDSTAVWAEDELVVETTGVRPRASGFPWGVIAVGPDSKVIERMSLLSPDELLYRFTVEDPLLYSQPWSAEFSMYRSTNQSFEYGCHEGNHSMIHILRAARLSDSP